MAATRSAAHGERQVMYVSVSQHLSVRVFRDLHRFRCRFSRRNVSKATATMDRARMDTADRLPATAAMELQRLPAALEGQPLRQQLRHISSTTTTTHNTTATHRSCSSGLGKRRVGFVVGLC